MPDPYGTEDVSTMADWHASYRVAEQRPLGRGGQARVLTAERRTDGQRVALKLPLAGIIHEDARRRLRREIKVQAALNHPHIMPILDHDPEGGWLVMPIATGNLELLRPQVDEAEFRALLYHITDGLAHARGHVHRDISPANLLALPDPTAPGGRRWVVADWGLVRRPRGQTTRPLTRSGQEFGTPGFAAPETFEHPHEVTAAADVYSLGRVMAWYTTGRRPAQNRPLLPDGEFAHWRYVIAVCTHDDPAARPADMAALSALLDRAFTVPALSPRAQAEAIVDRVRAASSNANPFDPFDQSAAGGDLQDLVELGRLALAHTDDLALYVDEVARLPAAATRRWLASDPVGVARVARTMAELLVHADSDWGRRQFDEANRPLDWILAVARALVHARRLDLLEDVTYALAQAASSWDRYPHNDRMRAWLKELDDAAGQVVGRAIRHAGAAEYYLQSGFNDWPEQIRSRALRAALGV